MSKFEQLEKDFSKVEKIKETLVPAEAQLESDRQYMHKLLGNEPWLGHVNVGQVRFSKFMLIAGGAFAAMAAGALFVGPAVGLMLGACCVVGGVAWVKQLFK